MNPSGAFRLSHRLAWGSLILAAVAAAAGLFIPELYRDGEGWVRQARASDLTTLAAAVPILAVALWHAARGSRSAELITAGALAYLVYGYAIFAFSVSVNAMTPLHYAILGIATWSLGLSLPTLLSEGADAVPRLPRRTSGIFLIGVAVLFALLWMSQIVDSIISGEPAPALAGLGLSTNPVWALDLAFALPAFVVAGLLLLRNRPIGRFVALPLLVFAGIMGASILVIFGFDAIAGAPLDPVSVTLIGGIVAIATGLSVKGVTASSHAPADRRGHRIPGTPLRGT
jgi:hypothetical protein